MATHCPFNCIVPPHLQEQILENGSPEQINKIQEQSTLAAEFRGRRESIAAAALRPTASAGGKDRSVYDAQNTSSLPGLLVRGEGDAPTGDDAVDEAYDGAGATYDLFSEIFGRNSIDDQGLPLISIVHYMMGYDNAFWDGSRMVYGDGDEDLPEEHRLFNRFTIAVDIIGHELAHGVTQYEANLVYRDQPGALNESFSDVFGSLVKQRLKNETAAEADWLVGEGLFTSNVGAVALRSMKDPGSAYNDPVLGKDPQPGHMDQYVNTTRDKGGVHINSGIPNKAFYNVAMALGGHAWEKAGRIWYDTLRNKLNANSDFQEAAQATMEVAGELYGHRSEEQLAVRKGWSDVGIPLPEPTPPRTEPPSKKKTGCLNVLTFGLLGLFNL